jgi:hypothetical protein
MTDAKKITRSRPTNYPKQIVIMTTAETYDAVAETAEGEGVSKSVVARRWMENGRTVEEAGGFRDL